MYSSTQPRMYEIWCSG